MLILLHYIIVSIVYTQYLYIFINIHMISGPILTHYTVCPRKNDTQIQMPFIQKLLYLE